MSKLKQKIQSARARGVYVFKLPSHVNRVRNLIERETRGRMSTRKSLINQKEWAVYVEGEFYPRINLTKREAANLAYAISISKKIEIEISGTFRALEVF